MSVREQMSRHSGYHQRAAANGYVFELKGKASFDLDAWREVWRRESESNRRRLLCRPLHDHSAIPPGMTAGASLLRRPGKRKGRAAILNRALPGAIWSGKRVSNSRPQPWQGCALPTELFPRRTALNYSVNAPPVKTERTRTPSMQARAQHARHRRGSTRLAQPIALAIAAATSPILRELSAATQMRPVSIA
jgi:hypothetical protein